MEEELNPATMERRLKPPTNSEVTRTESKFEINSAQRHVLGVSGSSVLNDCSREQEEMKKKRNHVEVLILCILTIIVWGLLLIPIVYYYLPLPQVSIIYFEMNT